MKFEYVIEPGEKDTRQFGTPTNSCYIWIFQVHPDGTSQLIQPRYSYYAQDGSGNTPEKHAVHLVTLLPIVKRLLEGDAEYLHDMIFADMEPYAWARRTMRDRYRNETLERLKIEIIKRK